MLSPVEHQDSAVGAPCRNKVGVLRHVSGLVDLAGVVDVLDGRELERCLGRAMATNFSFGGIVVGRVGDLRGGYLNGSDGEVVLGLGGRVGAINQTVFGEV